MSCLNATLSQKRNVVTDKPYDQDFFGGATFWGI